METIKRALQSLLVTLFASLVAAPAPSAYAYIPTEESAEGREPSPEYRKHRVALDLAVRLLTTNDLASISAEEVLNEHTSLYWMIFALMEEHDWQQGLILIYGKEDAIPNSLFNAGKEGRLGFIKYAAILALNQGDEAASKFLRSFLQILPNRKLDAHQKIKAVYELFYAPSVEYKDISSSNRTGIRMQRQAAAHLSIKLQKLFWEMIDQKFGPVPVEPLEHVYPGMDIALHPRRPVDKFPTDPGPMLNAKWWRWNDFREHALLYAAGRVRSSNHHTFRDAPFYNLFKVDLPEMYVADKKSALEFSRRLETEVIPHSINCSRDIQLIYGVNPQVTSHPAVRPLIRAMLFRLGEDSRPVSYMVHHYFVRNRGLPDPQTYAEFSELATAAMKKNGILDPSESVQSLADFEKSTGKTLSVPPPAPELARRTWSQIFRSSCQVALTIFGVR